MSEQRSDRGGDKGHTGIPGVATRRCRNATASVDLNGGCCGCQYSDSDRYLDFENMMGTTGKMLNT